jgi:type IV secretion system protein VirD4
MKPVTIYICVNQEDARALGVITGLLIEAMSAWLVAHKPKGKTRDGRDVGPFPVLFVLDEFPQMPKLQALIDGPAVGRGQKVSFLMIGQDLGQIKAKYGENEMETVISTTAAKVILPLNNETTAKRFSEMVGQRTMESKSKSRTVGLSRQTNPFASNMQKSLQGQPLIRPEDFMSLPNLKQHIILMQANMNRPIMANTPAYFKHPELKHLVYNPEHGMGLNYPPAPSMPPFMIEARKAEYEEDMRRAEEQAHQDLGDVA